MNAYVYTGGKIFPEYISEKPKGEDIIIAADSGYNNAKLCGVMPNILIGDFDSLGKIPDGIDEVLQLPPEKDLTDTQLAVETAIEKGADNIVIISGTGGRLDHTLSNLAILEGLWQRNVRCLLTSGQNRVRYIKNSGHILLRDRNYKYFSVVACDDIVKGVSIDGAKYPLKNVKLTRRLQYAISNEIDGNCALITVKKGGIYIIESRDI